MPITQVPQILFNVPLKMRISNCWVAVQEWSSRDYVCIRQELLG